MLIIFPVILQVKSLLLGWCSGAARIIWGRAAPVFVPRLSAGVRGPGKGAARAAPIQSARGPRVMGLRALTDGCGGGESEETTAVRLSVEAVEAGAGGPGAALEPPGPPKHSQALTKIQAGDAGPGSSCCLRWKPQQGQKVRGFRGSSEGPARPRKPVPADSGACGPDGCSVQARPNAGPGVLLFRTAPS